MERKRGMRRAEFGEEVAVTELVFVKPDGTERVVRFRVGRPYVDADEWRCPCESQGYDGRYPDMVGSDSMQALALALQLLRTRAQAFLVKGGRIRLVGEPDDTEGAPRDDAALIAALFGGERAAGG